MDSSRKLALQISDVQEEPEFKGWLYKKSKYLNLYRKRWFLVSNGILSYYHTHDGMNKTCRAAYNLESALIDSISPLKFVVSIPGKPSLYLKAATDSEKNRWISALELSRQQSRARTELLDVRSSHDGKGSFYETQASLALVKKRLELENLIAYLNTKANDLEIGTRETEQFYRRADSMLRVMLTYLERQNISPQLFNDTAEAINEYRVHSKTLCDSYTEYVNCVKLHNDKWRKILQNEREIRLNLEDMLQQLAKDHEKLENQARKCSHVPSVRDVTAAGAESFEDAAENLYEEIEVRLPPALSPVDHNLDSKSTDDGVPKDDSTRSKKGIVLTTKDRKISVVSNISNYMYIDRASSSPRYSITPTRGSVAFKLSIKGVSGRVRRTTIPPRPKSSLSIWSVLKNSIGKDLSKIPMPVCFNEPISMLQRLTEDLEYSDLIDVASLTSDVSEQMTFVAAFAVSCYSAPIERVTKPFNPLLGETFEYDRWDDLGWRCLVEQVSHHPPLSAMYAESKKDWQLTQHYSMETKFKGKDLQIKPIGQSRLQFKSGTVYTWNKVFASVHNIIVGNLWVENHGELDIVEQSTQTTCHLTLPPYSVFAQNNYAVSGIVCRESGPKKATWFLNGNWDRILTRTPIVDTRDGKMVCDETADSPQIIWERSTDIPAWSKETYYFTEFGVQLNEVEDGVAPTDSRRRQDQRLLEMGRLEEAALAKSRLEEWQRMGHANGNYHGGNDAWVPVWFKVVRDDDKPSGVNNANVNYHYNHRYWECKKKQDWSLCPNIMPLSS